MDYDNLTEFLFKRAAALDEQHSLAGVITYKVSPAQRYKLRQAQAVIAQASNLLSELACDIDAQEHGSAAT